MSTSFSDQNYNRSVIGRSLIDLNHLSSAKIYELFNHSLNLKKEYEQNNWSKQVQVKGLAALLFFEPSTRTRFSFESACVRSGVHPLILDGGQGTSLEKGETLEDTVSNIEAMKPLFFVIRAPDDFPFSDLCNNLAVPMINAGWGMKGHPTQALLDMLTVYEKFETVENKNVLFIGDIKHSRVVSSHLQLAEKLNYHIGYCCPDSFMPQQASLMNPRLHLFNKLEQALQWADAAVALRVQKERHFGEKLNLQGYIDQYALTEKSIKALKPSALIMHPGPINYGVEMDQRVTNDSRAVILKLVQNGTFLRQAVIQNILNAGVFL
ncbi:MAG: aspartate carbamoyltransferase catalytic subunit [Pseudobdellovibrio sp.]